MGPPRRAQSQIRRTDESIYCTGLKSLFQDIEKPLTMTIPTIGAYEAQTHLPQFLRQVHAGQAFDTSVHGVTVARLVPVDALGPQRAQALAQMRAFSEQQNASDAGTDLDLAAWICEGRA